MLIGQVPNPKIVPPGHPSSLLYFFNPQIDFGSISDARPVKINYYYQNQGSEAIQFANVKCSCGCMVPRYERRLINPGQTGFISILFDPKGKRGACRKSTTVVLKNGDVLLLRMKGEIFPDSAISPRPISTLLTPPVLEVENLLSNEIRVCSIPFHNTSEVSQEILLERSTGKESMLHLDLHLFPKGLDKLNQEYTFSNRSVLLLNGQRGTLSVLIRPGELINSSFSETYWLRDAQSNTKIPLVITGSYEPR